VNDNQINRETKVEGRGLKGWRVCSGVSGERFAQMGALDTRPSFLDHLNTLKQTQSHQNKPKQSQTRRRVDTSNIEGGGWKPARNPKIHESNNPSIPKTLYFD